jgi:hypothetical protein
MKFHSHRYTFQPQSGRGVGSFFSRIFNTIKRFIIPSVKKIASSDVGKSLGKAAATSVSSFGGDILAGKKLKEAGKESLDRGIKDLQKSVSKLVERKKKNKVKKKKSGLKGRKTGFQFFDP